jgi:predicted deacylase
VQNDRHDEDLVRSRRYNADGQGWSSICRILDGRMIGRSDDTVCDLHCAHGDEVDGFLG